MSTVLRNFNPIVLVATLITGCALAAVAVYFAFGPSTRTPFELDTASPDTTYRVHLQERLDSPAPNRHEVRFDVLRSGTAILEHEQLYEGGVYDDPFSVLYPEHAWISPSLLRFGRKDNSPVSRHDEIVVENATDRTLSYLRVNAGKYELLILLDLQPRSRLTLQTQAQTDEANDLSYVSCKGRFADGSAIEEVAGNFKVRGMYRAPGHYSITILDNSVQIDSKDFASLSQSAEFFR